VLLPDGGSEKLQNLLPGGHASGRRTRSRQTVDGGSHFTKYQSSG
jgi:hypothetical protein